jgi:flagellar protein FlaI
MSKKAIKNMRQKLTENFKASDLLSRKIISDVTDVLKEIEFDGLSDLFRKLKDVAKYGALEDFLDTSFPQGYDIIEEYWVNRPFAKVFVLYSKTANDYLYFLSEPSLSEVERYLLYEVKELVRNKLIYGKIEETKKDKEKILEKTVEEILEDYDIYVDKQTFHKFLYYIRRDFIGFYKIDGLMRDPYIEDISCDGWSIPIFVYHWNYGNMQTNISFERRELDSFVIRLAQRSGKHISTSNPLVDATLPDGSRIQLTLGKDVTARGSTFTIRRFREVLITPVDLIRWGTFSAEQMAYLWLAAENGKSMLFVGGTASGKTTSLNAVALFIPLNAKIVTIEDTREIKLPHMNWIPAVTRESFTDDEKGRIDMYDLLKAALRQRPEYILVGEVRGREAQTLFQAMSTGHTTFSTFHADSVEAAIHRLEYPPLSVPRSMISALDIVSVQIQTFVGNRKVRRNLEIAEITEIDPVTKNIKTMTIFRWDPMTDTHRFLLNDIWGSKVMREIMLFKAWDEKRLAEEFEKRKKLLEYMVEKGITSHEFLRIMKAYHANPDEVFKIVVRHEG